MYNINLWHTSGHAAKYKDNMFLLDIEGQEFGLKPMNCPGKQTQNVTQSSFGHIITQPHITYVTKQLGRD